MLFKKHKKVRKKQNLKEEFTNNYKVGNGFNALKIYFLRNKSVLINKNIHYLSFSNLQNKSKRFISHYIPNLEISKRNIVCRYIPKL